MVAKPLPKLRAPTPVSRRRVLVADPHGPPELTPSTRNRQSPEVCCVGERDLSRGADQDHATLVRERQIHGRAVDECRAAGIALRARVGGLGDRDVLESDSPKRVRVLRRVGSSGRAGVLDREAWRKRVDLVLGDVLGLLLLLLVEDALDRGWRGHRRSSQGHDQSRQCNDHRRRRSTSLRTRHGNTPYSLVCRSARNTGPLSLEIGRGATDPIHPGAGPKVNSGVAHSLEDRDFTDLATRHGGSSHARNVPVRPGCFRLFRCLTGEQMANKSEGRPRGLPFYSPRGRPTPKRRKVR